MWATTLRCSPVPLSFSQRLNLSQQIVNQLGRKFFHTKVFDGNPQRNEPGWIFLFTELTNTDTTKEVVDSVHDYSDKTAALVFDEMPHHHSKVFDPGHQLQQSFSKFPQITYPSCSMSCPIAATPKSSLMCSQIRIVEGTVNLGVTSWLWMAPHWCLRLNAYNFSLIPVYMLRMLPLFPVRCVKILGGLLLLTLAYPLTLLSRLFRPVHQISLLM